MLAETVTRWTQQWLEQGRQEGEQKGEQKGLQKAVVAIAKRGFASQKSPKTYHRSSAMACSIKAVLPISRYK